jgi:hypothetical protein
MFKGVLETGGKRRVRSYQKVLEETMTSKTEGASSGLREEDDGKGCGVDSEDSFHFCCSFAYVLEYSSQWSNPIG